jgi:hypothetical protein
MYSIFENPTVNIKIPRLSNEQQNDIFMHNLEKILEVKTIKTVIINNYNEVETCDDINRLIKQFSDKYFYLNECSNIKKFNSDKVCSYKNIDKIDELVDCIEDNNMFFLNMDLEDQVSEGEVEILNNCFAKTEKEVIIEFTSRKFIEINEFKKMYDILQNKLEFDFGFSSLFKQIETIKQHPCNAYLCSDQKCHCHKKDIPRYIYMNENGLYPYNCEIDDLNIFNQVTQVRLDSFEEFIYNNYKNNDSYKAFININKRIYNSYVTTQQLNMMPWNIAIKNEYYGHN